MQPVAPTSDPRGWWQDLSKTPGKLWNSVVFANLYLWNHRYLEAAVPPAKGSCCSTIKELLELLIWKLLPSEAESVRHSCCTAPSSSVERCGWEWVRAEKPRQAGVPLLSSPSSGAQSLLNPILPRQGGGALADPAPGGVCSRKALGHQQDLWHPLGRKGWQERP